MLNEHEPQSESQSDDVSVTSEGAVYELYTPGQEKPEPEEVAVAVEEVFEPVEMPEDDLTLNRAVADKAGVKIAAEKFTVLGHRQLLVNGHVWNPAQVERDAQYAAAQVGYHPKVGECARDICAAVLSRKG